LARVEHNNGLALDFAYQSNLLIGVSSPSSNLTAAFGYSTNGWLTNRVLTAGADEYINAYEWGADSLTQKVDAAGTIYQFGYLTNGSGQGTNVAVMTNYYKHTVAYNPDEAVSTVTYIRGDSNQVYKYSYDPATKWLHEIWGPSLTTTGAAPRHHLRRNAYGDVTNEQWETMNTDGWYSVWQWYDDCHNVTNTSLTFGTTNAPSNFWAYTWNTNWQVMTSATDPEGCKVGMEYTNALPSRIRLYYDASNSYDTLFSYTSNGLLSGVTNANGHYVQYYYNSYGFCTSVVPQAGITVYSEVNQLGYVTNTKLPSHELDASSNTVYRNIGYTVDEIGRISRIAYPFSTNGLYEYFYWDAVGNLTNHIDTGGRSTRYTYKPTGKLESVTKSLNGSNITTSIEHDNQFNTLKITDAKNRAVESYVLDIQDRVTSVTNLEGQTMSVTYGVGDYVNQITRFDGSTISNSYNSDGLLSMVCGPSFTNTFTYLRNGLLRTVANESGTISNTWNAANRLTSEKSMVYGLTSTVSFAYFPAGQISNVVSLAGTNTYTLDSADRVSGIQVSGLIPQPLSFSLSYDDQQNGLLSEMTCTNTGIKVKYSRDELDRLYSIQWLDSTSNTLKSFTYSLNSAGMIVGVKDESGDYAGYSYDNLDRLTGETHSDALGQTSFSESITYDEVGNRTSKTRDGITVNYAVSNGCNRMTGWSVTQTNLSAQIEVAGFADEDIGADSHWGQLWVSNAESRVPSVSGSNFWAHDFPMNLGTQSLVAAIRDDAGNTTFVTNTVFLSIVTNAAYLHNSAGCVTNIQYSGSGYSENIGLSWNSQYQLTEVSTNGVECERNGFDALGRRVWTWDGTTTNYMVYDGVHVLAEVDSTGGLRRAYTHGPGIDNWLAMTVYTGVTAKTYFYLTDHQGTVHAVADETGSIVESYRFDSWGRVLGVYNGIGTPLTESAIGNKILWQGREYSWKTGLYFFRARFYDPVTGRWLSNDPIGKISRGQQE
jgi:RHS repeat-associated protein